MHIVNLVCLLVVNFAVLSSAALCDSLNATPAEDFFGQPSRASNLKAPDFDPYLPPLIIKSKKKSKRASLDCSSSEACFSLVNLPFCIDIQTGDFHDTDQTTGNAITGDYLLADGQKGNLYYGPFPMPSPSSQEGSTLPEATAIRGDNMGIIATTTARRGISEKTNSASVSYSIEEEATAAATVTQGGTFVIAAAATATTPSIAEETTESSATATDVNEEENTSDAPPIVAGKKFPTRASSSSQTSDSATSTTTTTPDGSEVKPVGSGVTTNGQTVPGEAARSGLGMGMGMGVWIMMSMIVASVLCLVL